MPVVAAKERPILMSGPMVRAILDGRKTATRRVVNPQPPAVDGPVSIRCPYGAPGDRSWVRESFYADVRESMGSANPAIIYAATPEWGKEKLRPDAIRITHMDGKPVARHEAIANLTHHRFRRLRPSIFLPRWASRITLEIERVQLERLRDIGEGDAIAEGLESPEFRAMTGGARDGFSALWDQLNGKRPGCSWGDNPWVWAITFRRIEA